ncbi:chromosome segregation protein SMC, partial [Carnobacterium sp.]|uniref:chromosome segregation protein SMC n=1 Tax=Carnobacterium sp. TaxID=48221 RepID=UPI0028AE65A1
MQLKRIEIAGFKSFAEKTTIEFHEGVTAVVGPNGSGKSNIIEAIRWVLGEQSAKSLRGGKMNDIIFSGTDMRKPLNIAEVSLILENEDHFLPLDFSEINITRRLHRNGESEFYLNKQACRLRDIIELFMDSGLGKESFSIISQGKVEAIFNSKPEDRRSIFEEAAGVFKYKTRKKKAEQKLFETEDNLNRVQDIVYELDSQIEPLQIQSSIAKDYLLQKEQLKDVEIALTVVEISHLKEQWAAQQLEIAAFNQQLNQMKAETNEIEQHLQLLKQQKQQFTDVFDNEQAQLVQAIQQYEQLEGQKQVLNEQTKHTKENREQYEQSKRQTLNKIADLEKKITQVKTLTDEKMQKQIRDHYIDLMQQQTSLRNEQSYLDKTFSQSAQRRMKTSVAMAALEKEVKEVASQLTAVTADRTASQQEIAKKLLQYQEQQATIQKQYTQLEKKEKMMYDALRVVQQAKAKKESLQELKDDYTGFYQGVKEVLKHKKQIGGIVGAVAELIIVPKESEIAIDIALGAASQNIIVQNEESGRKAIQYLKQKHSGRATFLPLSTIKPRRLPAAVEVKVKNQTGFIGIASDIVQYPDEIASIVQNLLGTTIVAHNLKAANEIAKLLQYSYRVVTLEGDVMNAGGSMTGGANKKGNQSSLFSRKNELSSLTQQISQMEQTLTAKEVEVRTLKQTVRKEEQ